MKKYRKATNIQSDGFKNIKFGRMASVAIDGDLQPPKVINRNPYIKTKKELDKPPAVWEYSNEY